MVPHGIKFWSWANTSGADSLCRKTNWLIRTTQTFFISWGLELPNQSRRHQPFNGIARHVDVAVLPIPECKSDTESRRPRGAINHIHSPAAHLMPMPPLVDTSERPGHMHWNTSVDFLPQQHWYPTTTSQGPWELTWGPRIWGLCDIPAVHCKPLGPFCNSDDMAFRRPA